MKTNKIKPEQIQEAVEKQAAIIVRKKELYEEVKKINAELKTLSESAPPMIGSFGFKTPTDGINKTATGFEALPNISFIAQLEKEMGAEKAGVDEMEVLRQENELLKQKLAGKA